jgi:hypothetical protein
MPLTAAASENNRGAARGGHAGSDAPQARLLRHQSQVLHEEGEAAAHLAARTDHPPSTVIEHERRACAAAHRLEGACGIEPEDLGQGHGLSGRGDVDAAEHLVDHLHRLAGTWLGTDLDDLTQRAEKGAGDGVQPRSHDEQVAVAGTDDAPTHRCVDEVHPRWNSTGHLGDPAPPHRREHDEVAPGIESRKRSTTDEGVVGLLWGGHHEDEDLRPPRGVRWVRSGIRGAGGGHSFAMRVVGAHPVARSDDPPQHRQAHRPHAQPGNDW